MFQFYYLSHANNGQNVEKKLFPPEQKGNCRGTKGQFLTDKKILENHKRRKTNLNIVCVNDTMEDTFAGQW